MALPPSRTGRLLLLLLSACVLAACATATASGVRPVPQRWVLLGARDGVAEIPTLIPEQPRRGPDRPRITDVSVRGAGIEAVIQQLAVLPERPPDRFILRLSGVDAEAARPLSPERYFDLVAALLLTLRHRAAVSVTLIPERPPTPTTADTLTSARRLRLTAEYNEAIRAAARLHGASVAGPGNTQEVAAGAWPSGAALDVLRARARRGVTAGLRPDVVAKVGDSITSSPAFLRDLTETGLPAGGDGNLLRTLRLATAGVMTTDGAALVSPFARESLAARDRWSVADALAGGEDSPLAQEIDALRPGVAMVMFGTNDLTHLLLPSFEKQLDRLLAELDRRGVVALLSTIPERRDSPEFGARVASFNRAIRALALAHAVPLIDYHTAMAMLPNAGLAPDGIHPSICPDGAGVLTPACLRYGYNLRNLLTLQALKRLHVELNGPAVDLDEDLTGGR